MTITRTLAALGAAAALALVGVVGLATTADAVDGTMAVDPSRIVAGGSTTVSGTGCTPLRDIPSEVTITVSLVGTAGGASDITAGAVPDGQGDWSAAIVVKAAGAYTVRATCDQYLVEPSDYPERPLTVTEAPPTSTTTAESTTTSGSPTSSAPATTSSGSTTSSGASTSGSTAAACKPVLNLLNYTGAVAQGGRIGIEANCFEPGDYVIVILDSLTKQELLDHKAGLNRVLLENLVADDAGRVAGTVTIPLDTPVGAHTLTVAGELSGAGGEAPITVVAAVGPTATRASNADGTGTAETVVVTSTPDLANTGVNVVAMIIWGVVLVIGGGIALALERGRDRKHAGHW